MAAPIWSTLYKKPQNRPDAATINQSWFGCFVVLLHTDIHAVCDCADVNTDFYIDKNRKYNYFWPTGYVD